MFIRYKFSKGELLKIAKEAERKCDEELEKLLKIPSHERNFANTVEADERVENEYSQTLDHLVFMNSVSPVEWIRKEATQCEEMMNKYLAKLSTRKDIYLMIKD